MATWLSLFKKDFRLTKNYFLVGLVINLLIVLLAQFVAGGHNLYVFIPLLAAAVFHIFYLPIMLFISLRTEAHQLHLWLPNPQSALSLLLSKIVNGLIMTVLSLVTMYAMAGTLLISRFDLIEAHWPDTRMAGLLIFLHIIMISVMIGAVVILSWSLYHALKYRMGRFTWLAIAASIVVASWMDSLLKSTPLYKSLIEWGDLEMNFPTFSIDPIPVFAGEYVYHFIMIIGLLVLSSWVIDKKVEV